MAWLMTAWLIGGPAPALRQVRGAGIACRVGVSRCRARPRAVVGLSRYHSRLVAAAAFTRNHLVRPTDHSAQEH